MIAITEHAEIPLTLIRDWVLLYEYLMRVGESEPWVRETRSQLQIYDIRDVRYALLDQIGQLHVPYA